MGKQRRTNGMSDLLQMFDSYLTLWVPCHITAIGVALYTFTGVVSKYEWNILERDKTIHIYNLCFKQLHGHNKETFEVLNLMYM